MCLEREREKEREKAREIESPLETRKGGHEIIT